MIQHLPFDEHGLISAVIQLRGAGQVLTQGFMNAESLMRSLQTGHPHLIQPGPSGVIQRWQSPGGEVHIADLVLSETDRQLLVLVDWMSSDAARWTAAASVAERFIGGMVRTEGLRPGSLQAAIRLELLIETIRSLRRSGNDRSLTASLFGAGLDSMLLEVGTQVLQLMIATKNNQGHEVKARMSQLLHAFLVLMVERGFTLDDLVRPLAERAGLEEPLSQDI